MRLLLDQNLSPRLARALADVFPNSTHVHHINLDTADDLEIWNHARRHDFIIVTKDVDFSELSAMQGFPPKLIWLRVGNCTTRQIESLLRSHYQDIKELHENYTVSILALV